MNSASGTGGGSPAGDASDHEERYTLGIDARWRMGPFGLDPSLFYQTGAYSTQAYRTNGVISRANGDTAAWLAYLSGSCQARPLLYDARGEDPTGSTAG